MRLDAGTAYAGALITRSYDSLLVKVTTWAASPEETIARMHRALWEFRVRGVATNLRFLDQIISHPRFARGEYTTRFIDDTPELFAMPARRDRATRILTYLAETGSSTATPKSPVEPGPRRLAGGAAAAAAGPAAARAAAAGQQAAAEQLGPAGFARWMCSQQRVRFTDTTMRDAHQSLLATRVRGTDMIAIAPALCSAAARAVLGRVLGRRHLRCGGCASSGRIPGRGLAGCARAMPNLLLQMLLRSANAVGYSNYPDNVVRYFVQQAAADGIDLFRVFDSLNWVENMRVAMDAVLESGELCEAAICYSGDLLRPDRPQVRARILLGNGARAQEGRHAYPRYQGHGRPVPARCRARTLVQGALKEETGLPVHFHTHDTSGIGVATVFAAIEAGADAVDGAMDSMSGLTAQPSLGAIVEPLPNGPRDAGLGAGITSARSPITGNGAAGYSAFESDIRAGTSEVYLHGMPGGQYTNLREQARGLGLETALGRGGACLCRRERLFWACVHLRAVFVPIGSNWSREVAATVLDRCNPRLFH